MEKWLLTVRLPGFWVQEIPGGWGKHYTRTKTEGCRVGVVFGGDRVDLEKSFWYNIDILKERQEMKLGYEDSQNSKNF